VITVVGEALVDLIEHEPGRTVAYPGGSPANVAVALARLGERVGLLTQVGDDPHGELLRAHLRASGVGLAAGSLLDVPRTSTARTSLTPDGQASYAFDITWRRFPDRVVGEPDPAVACVHTGSLAAMLLPGGDDVAAIMRAARRTALVSFDPNCRPSLLGDRHPARERIEALVSTSDIVKASRDDLAWLYPQRSHQRVAQEWLARGAGLIVVTTGGAGAWAGTEGGETTVAAYPVRVVDTVGAGDAFTAGLLSALGRAGLLGAAHRADLRAIDRRTLTEVLRFAARVAAVACTRRGADPPTAAEVVTAG
jgi:fructokinase